VNWRGRRVLVTGAGGFIGSHLAERLVEEGAEVRALVEYNALGRWDWLDESPVAKRMDIQLGDIRDRDSVSRAVEGREVVFHLAALIGIPYSYHAPQSYVDTNITGTLNLLQAVREADVGRFVHTSTSEVYGTALEVPIRETHPLQGQSPYSASKIAADKMVEAFHRSFGLPTGILRPFNTFGPRQSTRAVIPTIITQVLAKRPVRLGNLQPTRDFNYVDNTVDAFLLAASAPGFIGKTVHVGTGREISIGDLARLIAEQLGVPLRVAEEDQRLRPDASEVMRLVADSTFAKQAIGWTPRVSFEDGLERTIHWMEQNATKYRPERYAL
jgi:NAD dependent epimerase/dehydratase